MGKWKKQLISNGSEIQQYKAKSQLELNKANRQLSDAENSVNLSKLDLEQSQAWDRSNRFSQG
jgi:hypothetical protein